MRTFKTTSILIVIAGFGASCGKPVQGNLNSERFKLALDGGRKVAYGQTAQFGVMGLASVEPQGVVSSEMDVNNQFIARIQFDTNSSPATSFESLDSFSREYLDAHFGDFQVASHDLELMYISPVTDKITAVYYSRSHQGVEVRDAYVRVSYLKTAEGYKLREINNRSYGIIEMANERSVPSMSDVQSLVGESYQVLSSVEQIFPSQGPNGIKFLHSSEVNLQDEAGKTYTVTLSHELNEIVEAYRHEISLDPMTFKASGYVRTYIEGDPTPLKVPFATIENSSSTILTGPDGEFAAQDIDDSVGLSLLSELVEIYDGDGNTKFPVIKTALVNSGSDYIAELSGKELAAINAYMAIQRVNRFARRHVRPEETEVDGVTFLDHNVPVKTNVDDGQGCNANYNPGTHIIRLYAANRGCADMSTINDVIYHEWGHGLDNSVGSRKGIRDGAFSEGIGDILASYMTNSPVLAPGFGQDDESGIRNLDNDSRVDNTNDEVHARGLVIGGAFWHLREALIKRHGDVKGAYEAEHLFFRHLTTTDSYLDSYQSVVELDDDDGNPATESPNYCLITEAFERHDLTDGASTCNSDPAPSDPGAVAEDVFVGILNEESPGKFQLMASSPRDEKIVLCLAAKDACMKDKVTTIDFAATTGEGRYFYTSAKPVTISNQLEATIMTKDASGNVKQTREIKFVLK